MRKVASTGIIIAVAKDRNGEGPVHGSALRRYEGSARRGATEKLQRARIDNVDERALGHMAGRGFVEEPVCADLVARDTAKYRVEARDRLLPRLLESSARHVADGISTSLDRPREETPRELGMAALIVGDLAEGGAQSRIASAFGAFLGEERRECLDDAPFLHRRGDDRCKVAGGTDARDVEGTRSEFPPREP